MCAASATADLAPLISPATDAVILAGADIAHGVSHVSAHLCARSQTDPKRNPLIFNRVCTFSLE